ncbi:unnamed protein product [Rotaria socialis]|uniref:Uncharacterized protein n=1 Tax=Rotaria socialis TaxID=392032 RepID=A0A821USM7_9BILA|nr:unnamed protein product [Rotaria socialis]
MGAARSTRQQNNFTLVSKRLIQQFQSTHIWLTGLPTPQSIINIEKCSNNLLHIAKWSRTAIESNHEATTNNVILSSLDLGQQLRSILPSEVSSDEVTEISRLLSSI